MSKEFKVGDRVEVVGKDWQGRNDTRGRNTLGRQGWIFKIDSVGDCHIENKKGVEDYFGAFPPSSLKLIGGNMEIKVGQVWKEIGGLVSILDVTPSTVYYRWCISGVEGERRISVFLEGWKLITDIEGDKKVENKIKINTIGLKLKMGVKTDNGVKGNIYSMSPQIVVVEDENGKHHSCQSKEVEILYSVPEEAVNPKTKIMTKAEARKLITQAKKVLNKK